MVFPKQEYWSELPFPSAGDLPNPGIEPESPESPALHVDSLPSEPPGKVEGGRKKLYPQDDEPQAAYSISLSEPMIKSMCQTLCQVILLLSQNL